jgi:acyl-CoA thioester hydrolase
MASDMMTEPVKFLLRQKVPFFDVDPMHVVWHGHYLKYFDVTRQAFAEKCGLNFYRYQEKNGFIFPVIRYSVKHIHPLRFDDVFICKLTLVEARVKIVMDFEIRLEESDRLCARGRTEQVALKLPEKVMELSIPDEVRQAFFSCA